MRLVSVALDLGKRTRGWLPGALRARAAVVIAVLLFWPSAAAASAVVELTGGVSAGFSAGMGPDGITSGPDGHVWFTEFNSPGGVARVNRDGSITELIGGVTPGFSFNALPNQITTGPDGHIWFTESGHGYNNGFNASTYPGGIARVNDDGSVTEFTGGKTKGLSALAAPTGITTGPDGNIWFTEPSLGFDSKFQSACYDNGDNDPCGGLARLNSDGSVLQFEAGHNLPGMTPRAFPTGITGGTDGNLWFTEPRLNTTGQTEGGVGRLNLGFANVTQFPAGTTSGFSTEAFPWQITSGTGGHVWFSELGMLGGVAYVNGDGTVSEFGPPLTPGFTASAHPNGIGVGPDGHMWFTEAINPGRVARVNDDGTVTELTGGSTSGFSANGHPNGVAALNGRLWFTEGADPGRVAYLNGPNVTSRPATGVGSRTATVNGTINPTGVTVTNCHFQFGTRAAYDQSVGCAQSVGGGSAPVAVSAWIHPMVLNHFPLLPGTTYHFRLVATNIAGTSHGADKTFTTAPEIYTVSPTAGPTSGGNTVVITGAGFASGARVNFGTTASTLVTFVSATKLKARAPAHAAGVVSVTVKNPAGPSATANSAYRY
jgi:streptogramin lyase